MSPPASRDIAISAAMPAAASDAKFARNAWIRALQRTAVLEQDSALTLPVLIEQLADRFGEASALESPEGSFSYRGLAARCRRYARWALQSGLAPGDVVALYMPNCAEYLAVWLGLSRVGITVALINNQLEGDALVHSIGVASSRRLIVAGALASRVRAVQNRLSAGLAVRALGNTREDLAPLGPELERMGEAPLGAGEERLPSVDDTALYIYTSGTTGLPKAAAVSPLPGAALEPVVRGPPRYRPRRPDVRLPAALSQRRRRRGRRRHARRRRRRGDPQSLLGLGFLARRARRALHAVPVHRRAVPLPRQCAAPGRTRHRTRCASPAATGCARRSGQTFTDALSYSAHSRILRIHRGQFFPLQLRGAAGSDRPDPVVSRAPAAGGAAALRRRERRTCSAMRRDSASAARWTRWARPSASLPRTQRRQRPAQAASRGMPTAAATERKVLRNVFKAGDAWYRTGDLHALRRCRLLLLRRPHRRDLPMEGRERVHGRGAVGALSAVPGVREGVVYGVPVPGADGRAGMAALVVDRGFRSAVLSRETSRAACRPMRGRVFLRLLPALEATGTFKPRKQDLAAGGLRSCSGSAIRSMSRMHSPGATCRSTRPCTRPSVRAACASEARRHAGVRPYCRHPR